MLNAQLSEKHTVAEAQLMESLAEKESLQRRIEEMSEAFSVGSGNEQQVCQLEKKVAELTKELDESNKLTIRLKLDHKNKIKAANKTLEKLKQVSTYLRSTYSNITGLLFAKGFATFIVRIR